MKWLKKEKEHESVSLTLLITITFIITLKLLLSGMVIQGYVFSEFTSMDWSTIFVPVAGLYFGRKINTHKASRPSNRQETSSSVDDSKQPIDPQ